MYIAIRRLNADESSAEYAFGENEERMGRLQLDRGNGESRLLETCPDDGSGGMFQRAGRKLFLHWQQGELPESTCWAS